MRCRVITPVGPGHEDIVWRAVKSVSEAKKRPGRFREIQHMVVPDILGEMGRSAARNSAMWDDWMFFLDADDQMMPDAFEKCVFDVSATFGAICLDGRVVESNRFPCTKEDILKRGPRGTLSMGFFYKGGLKFNKGMDAGEDFDFYMRLPSFVKVRRPLVSIGRSVPSAGGPRGYEKLDWLAECQKVINAYN